MPGIGAVVKYLSLGVTAALVAAGYALASPLTVVGASASSPVVLETSAPHGIQDPVNGAHVVVSGVAGVPEADGNWIALPTDPTHLALYSLGPDGTQAGVSGTGAYVSGGTIQRALVGDRILIGRQHVAEQAFAPRIVFIPRNSPFGPKSISNASQVAGFPQADVQRAWLQRAIATETYRFEIHVWGCATPADPEGGDFDATQVLYQQVIMTTHLVTAGRYRLLQGDWTDQQPNATQLIKAGHEFVFGIEIDSPVLDKLQSFVPRGTSGVIAINLSGAPSGDATTIEGV